MTSRNLTGFCLKGNLKNVMSFLKTRGLFYKVGILYLCKYGSGAAIVSVLFNFTYIRFLSSNAFSKSYFKYASTKVNPNTGFRHLKERHIFYQLFEKFFSLFFLLLSSSAEWKWCWQRQHPWAYNNNNSNNNNVVPFPSGFHAQLWLHNIQQPSTTATTTTTTRK